LELIENILAHAGDDVPWPLESASGASALVTLLIGATKEQNSTYKWLKKGYSTKLE